MSRLISTIALVVVLAGLGAYIYFVDSKRPAAGVEEKEKVFTVEADKLQEITVTSDAETSTLRKTDGTWRLTAPVQADADPSEISSLTSNLSSLEVNRVVEENASNLAEYGLAKPRIIVAFKAAGGGSGELHLGDKTATQSDIYAAKPGEKRVFLVPAFHETTFAKKPFDFRDKRILNFERDKVDVVEIAPDGAVIQLARAGSEWVVKGPFQARGDYSAIEGLVTKLATTSMTRIVDGGSASLSTYGLDRPAARVTVGAGSARATLAIGKEEDGAVYAQDQGRGLVFTIDPTVAADLEKPADEYRDKDLFEFRNFNLARLRISRGNDTHDLQKVAVTGENAGDKWQRVSNGAATDLDAVKMDDFLAKVVALRAQSFVPAGNTTGLDKPTVVLSASYDEGKFERVRMARTSEAFATRDGEPGAAKLDLTAYDEMIKALDAVLAPPAPAAAAEPAPAKPPSQ
jgi:hypothetical protein